VFPTYFPDVISCYKLLSVSSDSLDGRAETSRLLIVDDDRETLDLLSLYLTEQGFAVSCAENGVAMDAWLAENTADLVVLDLMLPGEDGLSIARRLSSDHGLPIVMISARGEELDRIIGLEVGADDYLPKPFNPRELLARIRAVLRRSGPLPEATPELADELTFGPFRFAPDTRALYRDGSEVKLSRAEFELLSVFVSHPNKVLSRDQIMDNLRARERDPFDRSIDVRVTRLRHKIEEDPAEPRLIRTVWGVGYQFTPRGREQ